MTKLIYLLTLALLIGCTKEVKPVSYYLQNEAELKQVLQNCETTQGSTKDQNSINADIAQNQMRLKKMNAPAHW